MSVMHEWQRNLHAHDPVTGLSFFTLHAVAVSFVISIAILLRSAGRSSGPRRRNATHAPPAGSTVQSPAQRPKLASHRLAITAGHRALMIVYTSVGTCCLPPFARQDFFPIVRPYT